MSLKIDRVQLEIVINNDQARKQLRSLEEEASKLTREMKNLDKTSLEYTQKAARLKTIKQQMDGIYESIGITNLTMKELVRRQSELNAILQHVRPGTEEYRKLNSEVTAIKNRIAELKGKAQETGISLKGMADGFNRYFGIITAFAASFTGIILGFKKAVDMANEYGKSVANLSALTGLAGKELRWMSDQAKEVAKNGTDAGIKVTAGAQAIVDAYTKVGSARPELLKDKEALNQVTQEAMILAEAAQSELQPAVDALAGVLNQFNAPASESRRIINAIAAGSKEGAGEIPYLTEAIEKSGTIAADAKISIENLVGIIETLAPRMAAPEMAGRNLRAIILKLQEGADETNPAIVGFSKAIENLAKQNLSATELTKLFGLENVTAAKILINNREETEKYTKAVTGTNTALEQAAINTNTDAAAKQRAINNYELAAISLGEKLSPAVTVSTNAFSYLLKVMVGVIEIFDKASSSSEELSDQFDKQVSYVADLNTKIAPLLSRYDDLILKSNKSAAEQEELKKIIEQVSEVMPAAITQFDKYGNAVFISTNRVREFIQAEVDRLKVVNRDAISENEQSLKLIEQQVKRSRERLDQIAKSGSFNISEVTTTGIQSFTTIRKATETEIAAEQDKYKALISQKNGYEAEIKRLNGDALNDELSRREKERKAAEEAESKKQAYAKKTRAELEALAASGDEYAKLLIDSNIVASNSAENLKTQYEQLRAAVEGAKSKLQDLVVSGNLEDALQAGVVANNLEKALFFLDKIVASGGDIGKVVDQVSILLSDEGLAKQDTDFQSILDQIISSNQSDIDKSLGATDPSLQPIAQKPVFDKNFYIDNIKNATDAGFQIFRNRADQRLEYESAMLDKLMNKELSNKNLTEEQKDKIRERYEEKQRKLKTEAWKRQRTADFIQSLISGSLATLRALAAPPGWPLNMPSVITAGAMAATESGLILAQKVPQFFAGKYSVIGAEDGKRYSATYSGRPETKIYAKPTLISEQGGELVVDASTTRNLMLNYPGIIEAIYAARVPQRAQGNLPAIDPAVFQNPQLLDAIVRLNNNLEKGIKSKIVLYDLEKAQGYLDDVRNESAF